MRRPSREPPEFNPDRWMVSYADFITLLFAFFVVMYSISSVNEGKYRVLSDTLRKNFRAEAAAGTLAPRATPSAPVQLPLISTGPSPIDLVAERLQEALGDRLDMDQISLRRTERGVEVSINSHLLFATGRSEIDTTYNSLLAQLAAALADSAHRIDVEGFTDDRPIQTSRFPSNWELSAARAAAVVRKLASNGVAPDRMAAVGFGPYRAVADNDSAAGRSKNRRVILVVRAEASRSRGRETGT